MTLLTRKDVVRALGGTDDDVVVSEIVNTGATADELAEAQAWLANNEAFMNSGKRLASGRIGRLVEILATIEDEEPGPSGHDAAA
jgi:hypothetical protein